MTCASGPPCSWFDFCGCWWQQPSSAKQHQQWVSLRERPSSGGAGGGGSSTGAHTGASGTGGGGSGSGGGGGGGSGGGTPQEVGRVLLAATATMPASETGCKVRGTLTVLHCLMKSTVF